MSNNQEKSLAILIIFRILSSLYYLPMQMKYALANNQWEFIPTMTVSEFIQANDWHVSESYIDSNPSQAYKVNDGDMDDAYEYAESNKDFYREMMHELYELYLLAN